MNTGFMTAAAGLVAVACALLVFPALRAGRNHGQLRSSFGWIVALLLTLPLGATALYRLVGTPAALSPESYIAPAASPNVDDTLAALRTDAMQHPGEVSGWLLLGRAAATLQRADMALDAYGHALKIAPDNADIMVAYAEAFAVRRVDHRLDPATRAILEHALTINPRHQHGLLLIGVADYQDGRFAEAASRWKQLRNLLPPGSSIGEAITRQIADAEARSMDRGSIKPNLPTAPPQ